VLDGVPFEIWLPFGLPAVVLCVVDTIAWWLRTLADHQEVAVLGPLAAREIESQHGGILLGFALHADRQIALDETMERRWQVRGRLVAFDHDAIAVDRADILLARLVVAAYGHLLAGKMVDGELDLAARFARVRRAGEALDDFRQSFERLLRHALVAADVGDLLVVAKRLQIVGIEFWLFGALKGAVNGTEELHAGAGERDAA
jgi:hypothetical protein